MEEVISWAWDVFQPLLFGLIGAEIRVNELEGLAVGEMDAQSLQNNSVIIVKNSNVTVWMYVNIFACPNKTSQM